MRKHVAIVGEETALLKKAEKAAEGTDLAPMLWHEGDALPPATVSVLASPKNLEAAMRAVSALGARHEELLELLVESIECREEFRPGSWRRVRDHATRFAQALGFSPEDQLTLERATLVHDIGKLRVSNDILLKSDLLTYHEWATLHKHPVFGAELVAAGEALRDTAEIVRHHHECYDGTGYPDGLEGEEIPHMARITKILDVYCAMTSPRHYREGHSTHEEAVAHLREERGKHFDPELVDIFINAEVGRTEKEAE